ncbi:nuclear transport factor 2 family protein [uncultured Shewanella sp.]|uniref:nuclear transport factor 2 family protein n=1 Tax=uncultured Shewanella sp. TaxID=173975 RepID=UPI00262043CF|nr:nuclear transport factor 2 family protein [uncultured Shewanella sp.]
MHSSTKLVSEMPEPMSFDEHTQPQIIDDFISMYQRLNKDTLHLLSQVYSNNIVFQDPLHKVEGLANLTNYFANLYENVDSISFDIQQVNVSQSLPQSQSQLQAKSQSQLEAEQKSQASIFWKMTYSHSKLNSGCDIHVEGMSHLIFNDKITSHRDYFDLGQMLYEPFPILGKLIQMVKSKASS